MASFVTNRDKLQVLNSVENSSSTDEVQRATEQLHVLNQYGDAVYAPVAPCTTHMNMEINNEGQGLDPLYDQELYLDEQAALHLDHNDGGQPHQVGGGNNIDDQLGDVQDGLTLVLLRIPPMWNMKQEF